MDLPKDPVMLMSVINTKLRDTYPSFDELCRAMCLQKEDILQKLEKAGFKYRPDINQFR